MSAAIAASPRELWVGGHGDKELGTGQSGRALMAGGRPRGHAAPPQRAVEATTGRGAQRQCDEGSDEDAGGVEGVREQEDAVPAWALAHTHQPPLFVS